MSEWMRKAIGEAPAGTSGLVVEPWSIGEVYGVAANWGDASAPVYGWTGDDEWVLTGRQVADYCHEPLAALRAQIAETLQLCGEDESEADAVVNEATGF